MAIAVEELGSAARAAGAASAARKAAVAAAPKAAAPVVRVTTAAARAGQTLSAGDLGDGLSRLLLAGAVGLIVLEVLSQLFGAYFNFDLAGFAKTHPAKPVLYVPLYTGQQLPGGYITDPSVGPIAPSGSVMTSAPTTTLVAASEGIAGGAGVQGVQSV